MSIKVLLVEDDRVLRQALGDTLELGGFAFDAVGSAEEALQAVAQEAYSLVVSDVNMPGMDGHQLLALLRRQQPQLPVLLMTAHAAIERAVEAMRQGAADYLVKPFEPNALLGLVERHAAGRLPDAEEDGPVACEAASRQLLELAARVARSDSTVLISGESGTGKEVLARFIHQQSPRAAQPFVAINCAAIPDNMLEATLFGHEKGAFTGAIAAQAGKFEQADGGTLLLDEISEMPLGLQAKLLRVLQEQEVEPLGSNQVKALNVRVIAATHIDLEAKVAAGQFRDDLYYRLNVLALRVPPLRERASDIPAVVEHLLDDIANRSGQPPMELSPEALALLCAQPWRGNVRELGNLLERAQLSADGPQLQAAHLLPLLGEQARSADAPAYASSAPSAALPTEAVPSEELPLQPLAQTLAQAERRALQSALAACKGNRRRAAMELGISRASLYSKLQQHGLSQR